MTNPYQVLGSGVPARFGRTREADDVLSRIDGNHVMVVAPRFSGKTVFLRDLKNHPELTRRFPERVFWDLTTHTPTTDEQFWECFTEQLATQLSPASEFFINLLTEQATPSYECIADVFEALQADKLEVLLILDGMDDILPTGFVSRNVLDNLRDLGQIGSLKFITASRKTLREISPASLRPSPFLNIFHTQPLRLGAISDPDWTHFLSPFQTRGVSFDSSALAELKNWTGGAPVLILALCHELWSSLGNTTSAVTLSKSEIDACATACQESRAELLARLWDDCEAPLKAHLTDLARGRVLASGDIPNPRLQELTRRGYIMPQRTGLKSGCRLLEQFIQKASDAVPDIKRLFGGKADYDKNIQPLLELRLDHLADVDPELRDHIERAVRELAKPHVCIAQFRSIALRSLDLIWQVEADNQKIPVAWVDSYPGDREFNPFIISGNRIPHELGRQISLLDKATDDRNGAPLRKLTRSIFLLLSQVHAVGNLGQHQGAANSGTVDLGFMAANCFAAIQLAEQLSVSLKS